MYRNRSRFGVSVKNMTTKHRSLQKTLVVGLTAGLALLSCMATLGTVSIAQHRLNQLLDSALAETAQRLLPLAVVEIINRDTPSVAQHIVSFNQHEERLIYLVRNKAGEVLLQSHTAAPNMFNNTLISGFSSSSTHRFYGAFALQGTVHIEVAEPLSQRLEAIRSIALMLLWPLLIFIFLAFICSWLFIRFSLRHLRHYHNEIEQRNSHDLTPVNLQGLPAEVVIIGESVNRLLLRLQQALEAERSFTANSAHELRTPIATVLAQTQRLQQSLITEKSKAQAQKIAMSLRHLAHISEQLMQLAKAEGGSLLAATPHDLMALLRFIVTSMQHPSSPIKINLQLPANAVFMSTIDQDAFAILIRNLIDNAHKHSDSLAPISVYLSAEGVLRVVNAGPIVAAATLQQLHKRFVRSNWQVQGAGLGLAIVGAIVQGINASMVLNSPATGQTDGFEVIIKFAPTLL